MIEIIIYLKPFVNWHFSKVFKCPEELVKEKKEIAVTPGLSNHLFYYGGWGFLDKKGLENLALTDSKEVVSDKLNILMSFFIEEVYKKKNDRKFTIEDETYLGSKGIFLSESHPEEDSVSDIVFRYLQGYIPKALKNLLGAEKKNNEEEKERSRGDLNRCIDLLLYFTHTPDTHDFLYNLRKNKVFNEEFMKKTADHIGDLIRFLEIDEDHYLKETQFLSPVEKIEFYKLYKFLDEEKKIKEAQREENQEDNSEAEEEKENEPRETHFEKYYVNKEDKKEKIENEESFLTEKDLTLKMNMDGFFESFPQKTKNSEASVFFAQKDIDTREETFEKKGYMVFTESVEFNKHFRFAPGFHSFTNRSAKLWNRANFPARGRYFFHHAPEKLDYKMLARAFYRSSVKDRFSGWLDFYENYKGYEKHYKDKLNQPKGKQGYYNAYNRDGDPTPRYEKELDSIDEIYTKEFRKLERKELREQGFENSKEKRNSEDEKEDIDKRIVNRYLNYNNDFSKMMRVTDEYKALPAQTAQQTLMLLFQAWQGYWVLKKEFNMKREKYGLNSEECPPRPGIPRYKDSDGEFVGIIPTSGMFQVNKYKGNISENIYTKHFVDSLRISRYRSHFSATAEIKLPKKTGLPPIRFRIPFFKNHYDLNYFKDLSHKEQIQFLRDRIQQIRIVPKSWGYKAEMVYKVPLEELELEKKKARFDPNRAGSVDLGVNILAAIVNNFGENPILIKGSRIKDINFRANRFHSFLQSAIILMKNEEKLTWGKINKILDFLPDDLKKILEYKKKTVTKSSDMFEELKKLQKQVAKKRYNRLENEFHRVANHIRDYFVEHRIGVVAIGRPKGWKKDIKKRVHKKALEKFNRKFQKIPFDSFLNKLWYKLAKEGIKVVTGPEDYTSKCSFLDQEEIKKHKEYLGIRGPSMKGRGKGGVGTKYPKARGLFKSKKYGYIHSDVNGAFNIGRKLLPSFFSNIPRSDMKLSPIGKFMFSKSLYAVS